LRALPPLVSRAERRAAELRFERSCSRDTGALLHVLAGARGRARVGEIGTGAGVGAAWIVSALEPTVPFVTVEVEPRLAAPAADLFRGDENVRVLTGDWHAVLPDEAPFDLLFYDGGGKQRPDLDGEQVIALLAPRGIVVMDDLTPGRTEHDVVRDFWLGHRALAAVELAVSAEESVIVAVRTH
jgi:predicted O-methyltransferase YrrM